MIRDEAEQLVALLPSAVARSAEGGDQPWWVVEQMSAVSGPDGDWFVELRWSQNGFGRGYRQRDVVSILTGDRVVGLDEMAAHIRHLIIEEPHGTHGTAASDGRVWWDSAEGGEPIGDWSAGRVDDTAEGLGEVIAGWIVPVTGRPSSSPGEWPHGPTP